MTAMLATALVVQAQNKPGQPNVAAAPPPVAAATDRQPDSDHTRNEFHQLLNKYPPALRRVLALDPKLMADPSYIAPYPALASFLAAHPEINRNPSFFLDHMDQPMEFRSARTQAMDLWKDILGGLAALTAFAIFFSVIAWLIKTVADYRRWSRLTKIQTEVHTKLLDRFNNNEDLLAYMKSAAGAKFLESTPIALDGAPRAVGAPLSRILWSIQGGVVAICAGVGLLGISTQFDAEVTQPLRAIGILVMAIGIGFLLSAGVSYVISMRLGLIERKS